MNKKNTELLFRFLKIKNIYKIILVLFTYSLKMSIVPSLLKTKYVMTLQERNTLHYFNRMFDDTNENKKEFKKEFKLIIENIISYSNKYELTKSQENLFSITFYIFLKIWRIMSNVKVKEVIFKKKLFYTVFSVEIDGRDIGEYQLSDFTPIGINTVSVIDCKEMFNDIKDSIIYQ
jgi:hypothetical protein